MVATIIDRLIYKYNRVDDQFINNFWNIDCFSRRITESTNWYTPEEEKQYYTSGNKQYTEADVRYDLTAHRFRSHPTCQHKQITEESIVCFGCSNTFGIGLPWELTWPAKLNQYLGTSFDVVNYGMPGASCDYMSRVISNFLERYKPGYICCFFPEINRRELFSNNSFQHFTPRKSNEIAGPDHDAFIQLSGPENSIYNFIKNYKLINTLCSLNNVKLLWSTWSRVILNSECEYLFDNSYVELPITYTQESKNLDRARDNLHIGPELTEHLSQSFGKKIL